MAYTAFRIGCRALWLAGAVALCPLRVGATVTVFIDITCAQYIEAVRNGNATHYNWFLAGFITGTNWAKERLTPEDAASYRVWVNSYCERNPFDLFVKALGELDKQLGPGPGRPSGPAPKK